jgi:hypothetical protein
LKGASLIRSLIQFSSGGRRGVAALDERGAARVVNGVESTLGLAREALAAGVSLGRLAGQRAGDPIDLSEVTPLAPVDHPDSAHCVVTGTGLTHLGSAEGRDRMHKAAATGQATDSMRMFLMGLEGGKPEAGMAGVQPEWFYKGDGSILVAPGAALTQPCFAADGGEEPEIAGLYLIDADGAPVRLGFCLANEFSDHVTEQQNYLWLGHSKLRQAALGSELLLGELPRDVRGMARILRGETVIWEKPFLSGEANMSHSIANIEHHHFKYPLFRRPGDIHVHFFGTSTLSFADGVRNEAGDVFEIEADAFTIPLRNPLACEIADAQTALRVRAL